ncbi:MAG: glycosyltransferase family A protein [Acidimicrobiales bacterium]|nr:glycosyltransferase family A protein [Acidimicrobiales bacterium]
MQPVTIIAGPRDRFSVTERWLDNLFATTPGAGDLHRVIFVAGGAPQHLRDRWTSRFGDRVEFVLRDDFVNQPQVRNIGLAMADTELSVLADNDCYPRAGWLEAMVRCQQETGAVMVSPLILQKPDEIHCAGTDLYKNVRDGKEFGHKYLRFYKMPYNEGSNLTRSPIDYGELHLELVETKATIELEAFDEAIPEVGEVDSGLAWAKGGRTMYFEPEAVVHFDLRGHIDEDDIEFFAWRWDFDSVAAGYRHFYDKRGFDVTEEDAFSGFLLDYNAYVGQLARRHPSATTLRIGHLAKKLGDGASLAPKLLRDEYRRRVNGAKHRSLSD